jgi:hypothetical protein
VRLTVGRRWSFVVAVLAAGVVTIGLPAIAQATNISVTEGGTFVGIVDQIPPQSFQCNSVVGTIDWGDGTITTAPIDFTSNTISDMHTYIEEGSYTTGSVTFQDSNQDCATQVDPLVATVADAPLGSSGTSVSVALGSPFNGTVASFSDADVFGAAGDYTAVIDWGDGARSPGTVGAAQGVFNVTASHTYTTPGSFVATVSIRDQGGAATSASTTVAVGTGTPGSTSTVVACSPGTVMVGRSATCRAVVSSSSGPPSGTVSFANGGAGGFSGGGRCVLSVSGASSRCTVSYTPSSLKSATQTITARYGGDSTHTGSGGVTTVALPPVSGVTANVTVISGAVVITAPASGRARLAAGGASPGTYVPLKGSTIAVPMGSTIDARKGMVAVSTAGDYRGATDRGHRIQTGTFSAAMFTVKQLTARQALLRARRQHKRRLTGIPSTDLVLANPPQAVTAAHCRRTGGPGKGIVRSITGVAKGLYRTIGAASTTIVQDGSWSVQDRCDGTLTEVGKGRAKIAVAARRHHRARTVTVGPGQSYLVKARFLAAKRVVKGL